MPLYLRVLNFNYVLKTLSQESIRVLISYARTAMEARQKTYCENPREKASFFSVLFFL
jgi:hypothetical protein